MRPGHHVLQLVSCRPSCRLRKTAVGAHAESIGRHQREAAANPLGNDLGRLDVVILDIDDADADVLGRADLGDDLELGELPAGHLDVNLVGRQREERRKHGGVAAGSDSPTLEIAEAEMRPEVAAVDDRPHHAESPHRKLAGHVARLKRWRDDAKNAGEVDDVPLAMAANGPTTFEADRILRSRGIAVLPDLYVNAGGVIVSYFEWVKNLTHIPFGLMERRHHETSHRMLAHSLEAMTGMQFPSENARAFLSGAHEIDLVRSGLDEIMRGAYQEISNARQSDGEELDMRTAAYTIAIKRISNAYSAIGL